MGKEKFQRPIVAPSFTPAANGVTAGDIASNAVTTVKIADSNVTTAKLASGAVTNAKAKVFTAVQTATTGSAQSVAHGLGATPSIVMIVPTDGATVTPGTHDGTSVKFTATGSKHVDIFAWA